MVATAIAHQRRIGLEKLDSWGLLVTQTLHSLLKTAALPVPEGFPNPGIEAITCDSRSVGPGCLFVGLPGERVDGGQFWQAALEAGAAAALIGAEAAESHPPTSQDPVLVLPAPVAHWAGELAAAFWQQPSCGTVRHVGESLAWP